MTVRELIEKLETMPQDLMVTAMYTTATEEEIHMVVDDVITEDCEYFTDLCSVHHGRHIRLS